MRFKLITRKYIFYTERSSLRPSHISFCCTLRHEAHWADEQTYHVQVDSTLTNVYKLVTLFSVPCSRRKTFRKQHKQTQHASNWKSFRKKCDSHVFFFVLLKKQLMFFRFLMHCCSVDLQLTISLILLVFFALKLCFMWGSVCSKVSQQHDLICG